jgi:hypothetical protein
LESRRSGELPDGNMADRAELLARTLEFPGSDRDTSLTAADDLAYDAWPVFVKLSLLYVFAE